MAWTAPITFTSGRTLTAAILNTYLRDNMLETAPAKATETGNYFAVSAANVISERKPVTALVATAQSTTSTSYVNLATVGPEVTVDTGDRAFVIHSCRIENNTNGVDAHQDWAISGATTRGASDVTAVSLDGTSAADPARLTNCDLYTLLTPGSNTFTCKYRVGGNTGTFADRRIIVWPF